MDRARTLLIVAIGAAFFFACSDTQTTAVREDVPGDRSFSIQGAGQQVAQWAYPDGTWSELAVGPIPGFAGLFIDAQGVLVVSATTEASEQASLMFAQEWSVLNSLQGQPIRFRRVEYDFYELNAGRNRLLDLLARGVINMLDVDEVENAVVVGIRPGASKVSVEELSALANLPEGAVRVIEASIAVESGVQDHYRPVMGGTQVIARYNCTLGFNTASGGDSYAVGASHCSHSWNDVDSGVWEQAYVLDVAYEIADRELGCGYSSYTGRVLGCGGVGWRASDSQMSEYYDSVSVGHGRIAKTTYYSSTYETDGSLVLAAQPYFNVLEGRMKSTLLSGLTVDKVGRATGWTRGTINQTCVDITPHLEGEDFAQEECQYGASYWSQGGDSGSPVFVQVQENHVALVGIHHAHDTVNDRAYFSPLDGIEHDLSITLDVVGDPLLNVSIAGPTSVSSQGNYTWTSSVSGGDGVYTYAWYRRIDYYKPRGSAECHYQTSWSLVGTGSSYSEYVRLIDLDFDLMLTVQSGTPSQTESDTHDILVGDGSQACPQ